jgi:hypothetical protein
MTVIVTPGTSSTFLLIARQWAPDGPLQDVTNLTFTLQRTDGTVLIGPTAAITHVSTGTYTFTYAAPVGLASGDGLALWHSDQGDSVEQVVFAGPASSDTGQSACAPWPATYCNLTGLNPAVTGIALQAASDILYNLSGKQFGLCTFTFRPCRDDCFGNAGGWPFLGGGWWQWGGGMLWPRPVLFDGAWFNLTCGSCPGSCSCGPLETAMLPGPVHAINEVKVDGVPLLTTAYRVDNFRELIRTDGGRWPICQNMAAADTQPNTWSVTAVIGQDVPALGQLAVGELTVELANSLCGNACKLPATATQMTRQGVTVDMFSLQELLKQGFLGLRFCDTFVGTYNPHRLQTPPQVFDVDRPNQPRRAGT